MSKVTLFIATSLDGYIAGTDGNISWLFSDQDYGYKVFYKKVDAVVMGHKTYKQSVAFGETFEGKECYVLSRRKKGMEDHVTFVKGIPDSLIGPMSKAQRIWLVGGSEIIYEFMKRKLVDEFEIFVHPILLGDGIPLFKPGYPQQELALVDVNKFESGLVQLSYRKSK